MTAESLAIIAVILALAFMFLRARKKIVAAMTLPLISVPLFYLPVLAMGKPGGGMPRQTLAVILVMVGAVVGVSACFLLSRMIPTQKGKTGYLAFTFIFEVAVAIGYIINIL